MKENEYKERYESALNQYKEMLDDYEKKTTDERYHEILQGMPFEFLNASQLCEQLSLYEKLDTKPRMIFSSLDEVRVFYRNLINFNKKSGKLLDDASYIAEIGRTAEKLNNFVMQTPYLDDTLCVQPNTEIIRIAKKCLSEIPQYPRMLTKKFRWNFIESAILSLEKEDLKWLVESKVIKSDDIDHLSLIEQQNGYQEKMQYLCEILNHPQIVVQTYQLKLKGVTFPNDDGSSRQENLLELKEYADNHPDEVISLQAESYTYTPEVGSPEPAIKVSWSGKVIGNVARVAAEEITEKFNSPQFTAILERVSGGGDGMMLGCVISLNVIAPSCIKEKSTEIQQEVQEA